MKDLNEIRLKINEIDGKMRKLFSERMAAAKEVAEYKMAHRIYLLSPRD